METALTTLVDRKHRTPTLFHDIEKLLFDPYPVGRRKDEYKTRETDEFTCIDIAMPGVKKNAVDISIENGTLIVSRKSNEESARAFTNYESTLTWRLTDRYDVDGIFAEMEDGILTISLPKQAKAKSRVIEIK